MKKKFILLSLLFLISTINTMEHKQLQVKNNFESDPFRSLFDKKTDKKKNTYYVLKSENTKFKDILPIIGKFVLTRPEYKKEYKEKCFLNFKIHNWLLTQLLFVNKCNKEFHPQLEKPEQLKLNMFLINDLSLAIHLSVDFEIKLGYSKKLKCNPSIYVLSSELFSKKIEGFPTSLIKANIYLKKIHRLHKKLLNNIYEKGIVKKKVYPLNELEEKHFKLLPKSFQTALDQQVASITSKRIIQKK